MSNQIALTDSEVVRALFAASIPATYHRKDKSLQSLQSPQLPFVEDALKFAKTEARHAADFGSVIEVGVAGVKGYDFTYMFARALTLAGNAVSCVSLPALVDMLRERRSVDGSTKLEELSQSAFLIVVDLFDTSHKVAPYDRTTIFELEWFLRSWVLNEQALVVHGTGSLGACEWWGASFKSVLSEKCSHRFHEVRSTKK